MITSGTVCGLGDTVLGSVHIHWLHFTYVHIKWWYVDMKLMHMWDKDACLTRPGWTISWLPMRRHCTWINFWKLSWEIENKSTGGHEQLAWWAKQNWLPCRHLPLVSWCHWHDWPPPSLLQGHLSKKNKNKTVMLSHGSHKGWRAISKAQHNGHHFTLRVLVIGRVFGEVFQIVCRPDFTHTLKIKWKLQRALGYKG